MIAMTNEIDRYVDAYGDSTSDERFERFTYRRGGEFPVRSHSSQTRAKMRSRATPAARRKARSFNGANRRGMGKQFGRRELAAF